MRNSIDIIRPFTDLIQDRTDVQIIGGIGALALTDAKTTIDHTNKEVHAHPDTGLSQLRDNRSKRDIDVLVLSSDPDKIEEVEQLLEETVGDQLKRAVFGIHDSTPLERQRRKPLGFTAFRAFVSDRYESADGTGLVKALFPFSVPISASSLEPWYTTIGDTRFPVASPHTTLLNYASRSIGGLRPKDEKKVTTIAARLGSKNGTVIEDFYDDTYRSQVDLVNMLHSLRGVRVKPALGIPGQLYSRDELYSHEGFMAHDHPDGKRALATAAFKASAMHTLESHQWIVDSFQLYLERFNDVIVKNK